MNIMSDDYIVYAPVAIPYESDCDGDKLSKSEILYASTKFMELWQRVDQRHCLAYGECPLVAEVVDSIITSYDMTVKDIEGNDIFLPSGSWVLKIRVTDDKVKQKINDRTYKGVSLMAESGTTKSSERITITQLGDDWVATAVSIVANPCVPKARFIEWESRTMEENKIKAFVESIKSALSSLEAEPVETVEEEIKEEPVEEVIDVVKEEEPVIEEVVKKEESEQLEITGEHVAEAIKAIKNEKQEEYATKSDIQELRESIDSLKNDKEAEALKSLENIKDEEIVSLKSRIEELELELKNVGQSKVIKDCGCGKKEKINYYDFEDRDCFGRKI